MKNLLGLREEKLEELPNRELRNPSTRHSHRGHHWGEKYPSNKVIRFLHSNVGNRWDKVSSKYHNLEWIPHDLRNLEHIKWHVIVDTFLKNGKVYHIPSYRSAEEPIDTHVVGTSEKFYVHPQSKALCVTKPRVNVPRAEIKTMHIVGDYHQLLKLDGLWYEVKAQPIKPDNGLTIIDGLYYTLAGVEPVERIVNGKVLKDIAPADGLKYKIHNGKLYLPAKDPNNRCVWSHPLGPKERIIEEPNGKRTWMRWNDVDRNSFKIILRRQLNSKDLKKHGLKNDSILPTIRCKKCGGIVGKDCNYHYCTVCSKPNELCKCNKY